MNRIVRFKFILVLLLLSSSAAFAEYRAYELEVFDRIVNTSRKVITSFSPSDFIQTADRSVSVLSYGLRGFAMATPLSIKKSVRCRKPSTRDFKKVSVCR
jgi:hypothetical protein